MSGKRKDKKGRVLRDGESQRKDLRYDYRYTDPWGKRRSVYADTLDELRKKEREIKKTLEEESGVNYAAGQISMLDLVKRYLTLKTVSRYNTKINYSTVLNLLTKDPFAQRPIRSIKVSDAKLWFIRLQQEGKRYCTITNIRGVVKPAFDLAWDEEIIRRNPFSFKITDAVVNDTVPRVALTEEQETRWMNFIRNDKTYSKYYDEFIVLLGTGMRVSEFCGLTKKDVDFDKREIHVNHQLIKERHKDHRSYFVEKTKTVSGCRVIPMTDEVYESLKRIVDKRKKPKTELIVNGYTGFILLDTNGNPKVALHIENECRWAMYKYNKLHPNEPLPHITPHVYRHTFCTRMAQKGMEVKALQYLMGHSDASVTMNVYTHSNYQYAAEQLKLITKKKDENAM